MSHNYINELSFINIITWLLHMRNDDIRSKFCLLKIENKSNNTDSSEDLAIFLSKKLRDSDLVTVYDKTHWCLLPTDNIKGIQDRLMSIAKTSEGCALSFDDYDISSYLFPRYSLHRVKSGKDLLDMIKEEKNLLPDRQLELTMANGIDVKNIPLYSS